MVDLSAIRARAEAATGFGTHSLDATLASVRDVPALVEEVTRLRAIVSACEWVPVGVRLPEEGVEVLVATDESAWGFGVECSVDMLSEGGEWALGDEHGPVTHWMPLPSPPEDR